MKPLRREITLVFGQTGTGKSQFTKRIIKGSRRCIVIDPQDEYEAVHHADNEDELREYLEKNPKMFRVAYSDLRGFDYICDLVSLVPDTLLVVEESQRIVPPAKKLPESFEDLIYRGRHSGTSIHLVAQRPTTVDIAVRSQFNRLVTFRQSEARDINWITDVTGYNLDEEIRGLAVMEYVEIGPAGWEKKKLSGFVK